VLRSERIASAVIPIGCVERGVWQDWRGKRPGPAL
jgi:hypothetical protein